MSALLVQPVRYWAKVTPAHPAIVYEGNQTVSYADLDRWTDATAHLLVESGCRPGDRLAIVAQNSIEWCVTALAALRAGLTVVPLNHRLKPSELDYLIDHADPALIVTDLDHRDQFGTPAGVPVMPIANVRGLQHGESTPFPSADIDETQAAAIVFTSGTTALPKGVVYTHRSVANYIFEQSLHLRAYRQGIRMLFVLPLAGAPGVLALTHMTTHGGTLFLEPGFEPEDALRRMVEKKIQVFWGVPVLYDRMAALSEFSDADLTSIEIAMIGSTRVQQSTIDKWTAKGVVPLRHYGMTEVGGSTSITTREDALAYPDSVGVGGVFTEHRVVRPDGTQCDPGEPGEILIKGPSITPGYWRNEEASAQLLRDGWVHSGDIGVFGTDGRLRFVERKKDLIVTRGGHNIAPAEIESVVGELPDVDEVAVVGYADPATGEVPVVIVGLNTTATAEAILAHCRIHLADYKIPKAVLRYGQALPRNPLGKVSKPELRKALVAHAKDIAEEQSLAVPHTTV